MLILRRSEEAVKVPLRYRGEEIELSLRPLTAETADRIRKKHRKHEYTTNPATRKLEKVAVDDTDAASMEMLDYVLESWSGIGTGPGKELPVTRENKFLVASIPPMNGEQPLMDFIFDTARQLAVLSDDEAREQEKN